MTSNADDTAPPPEPEAGDLEDYGGPFRSDFRYEDLSKEALVRLVREYALAVHILDRSMCAAIGMSHVLEEMQRLAIEEWRGASPVYGARLNCPAVPNTNTSTIVRDTGLYARDQIDFTDRWQLLAGLIEMSQQFGVDSMAETAEHVAAEYGVSRGAQDEFALRSQERTAKAQASGRLAREIVPVAVP